MNLHRWSSMPRNQVPEGGADLRVRHPCKDLDSRTLATRRGPASASPPAWRATSES
jgi:hypothetical protein